MRLARTIDTTNEVAVTAAEIVPSTKASSASAGNWASAASRYGYVTENARTENST